MDKIKSNIVKNISKLRQYNGLTQMELAERINYSDKAVSKWERGESVPDISVLAEIAKLFGVDMNYMIEEHHEFVNLPILGNEKYRIKKHALILGMSVLLVWLIATFVFVILHIVDRGLRAEWLSFVYAVPVSMIVWLVLNSIWFSKRRNFIIISLLMWTLLLSMFISFLVFGFNIWLIFLLGIPGQFIIILWANIGQKKQIGPITID